jgi:hypothetical protein
MKLKHLPLFTFIILLLGVTICRAGISVNNPPGSQTGGWFTINFGLGSPYPGKIAYVSVTKPDGAHFTVGQAENVPDYSQTCYLFADIAGTYRFFYEYSFESQGVPRTVVFSEDHYITGYVNNSPTIEWTSAPVRAETGQSYYIEAHGHDANSDLTAVSIWKEWSPFAFAGGGNGTDGWSGNPSTDTGDQWIDYMAQSRDAQGNTSSVIYTSIHIQAAPTVSWTNNPTSVDRNTYYTIRADGHDVNGDMTGVHIYREGQPFAFALFGNGTDAYSANPDYAGGEPGSDIHYMAEAHDSLGGSSGYIYCTVRINNNMPWSYWSPAILGNVYINGQYGSTAGGWDPDGNLQDLLVYCSWSELLPGGGVNTGNTTLYDTIVSSGGSPASRAYSWQTAKPYKYLYRWWVVPRDKAGLVGLAMQLYNIPGGSVVATENRPPRAPTLQSAYASIGLGQSVTISGNGLDDDENATNQYLWYQGPADAPSVWHTLTVSSYASGTGNTVANYTFTPTQLGTYRFKTRVDDFYDSSVEVSVNVAVEDTTPPVAPTNLAASEIHPSWAYLVWVKSASDDVTASLLAPVIGWKSDRYHTWPECRRNLRYRSQSRHEL